jgi:hypothetical protein
MFDLSKIYKFSYSILDPLKFIFKGLIHSGIEENTL